MAAAIASARPWYCRRLLLDLPPHDRPVKMYNIAIDVSFASVGVVLFSFEDVNIHGRSVVSRLVWMLSVKDQSSEPSTVTIGGRCYRREVLTDRRRSMTVPYFRITQHKLLLELMRTGKNSSH